MLIRLTPKERHTFGKGLPMLPKYLLHALNGLARSGRQWSITTSSDHLSRLSKLVQRGLVRSVPRYVARGPYKGTQKGSDFEVTKTGIEVLSRELSPSEWKSARAVIRFLEEIKD
jgi:hypothetical protein